MINLLEFIEIFTIETQSLQVNIVKSPPISLNQIIHKENCQISISFLNLKQ